MFLTSDCVWFPPEMPQRFLDAAWRLICALIPPFQSHSLWAVLGNTFSPFWCSSWISGTGFLRYVVAMINSSYKIAGVLGFSLWVWPVSRSGMGTENGFDPPSSCIVGHNSGSILQIWVKRAKGKGFSCVHLYQYWSTCSCFPIKAC